jgi:hypothetical protein
MTRKRRVGFTLRCGQLSAVADLVGPALAGTLQGYAISRHYGRSRESQLHIFAQILSLVSRILLDLADAHGLLLLALTFSQAWIVSLVPLVPRP